MKPQPTLARMQHLQKETQQLETQLTDRITQFLDSLQLKNIWAKVKRFFSNTFWRKRTLYALGAAAVVYLLLRGALGSSRKVVTLGSGTNGGELIVEAPRQQGMFSGLVREAIQMFLLSYARKLLNEYLNRQNNAAA